MDDAALMTRLAQLEAHVNWLYQNSGYAPPYANGATPPPTAPMGGGTGYSAAVMEQVNAGNKIGAIKQYREETGVGLREAKDAIDRLC